MCRTSSRQFLSQTGLLDTPLDRKSVHAQESELLEGAEELERLERQVRSSPGRASLSLAAAPDRRSSGAQEAAEQPLLDT